MDFYITISFEIQLGKLCKKPKEGYCTCRKDICKQFPKNITFQLLWERPVMLLEQDGLKIIKENACNSGSNLGNKAGFRIIYLLNKETEEISFLYIYPKRGKHGQETISDNDIEKLLLTYINDKKNNLLKKVDVQNELSIILH